MKPTFFIRKQASKWTDCRDTGPTLVSRSRGGSSNKAVQQDRGIDAVDFALGVEHAMQDSYPVGVEQHLFLNGCGLTAFLASVFPMNCSPEERMARVVPQSGDPEGDQQRVQREALLDREDNLWDQQRFHW